MVSCNYCPVSQQEVKYRSREDTLSEQNFQKFQEENLEP